MSQRRNTNGKYKYEKIFNIICPSEHANANLSNKIPLHTYGYDSKTHNIRCWQECNWNSQTYVVQFNSVQFSHSVVSDSLWPHESQHARTPCPSPSPRVQTRVHRVRDAIQPSYPQSSPSSPAFNLSQHQGLFKWVSFSHQVAKVLELQLQHQFF